MTAEIRMTVTAPVECTEEQFEEWIRYSVHDTCTMSSNNPLVGYEIEPNYVDIDPV